jgi:hypothetical protein
VSKRLRYEAVIVLLLIYFLLILGIAGESHASNLPQKSPDTPKEHDPNTFLPENSTCVCCNGFSYSCSCCTDKSCSRCNICGAKDTSLDLLAANVGNLNATAKVWTPNTGNK